MATTVVLVGFVQVIAVNSGCVLAEHSDCNAAVTLVALPPWSGPSTVMLVVVPSSAVRVTIKTSSFSIVPPTVSVSTWAVVLAPPSQIFVAMS